MKLKHNSQKPLYAQIKEYIISNIAKDILKPGQKIPSERKLCEKFNVSRITIRRAIDEAVKEGYLYNQHGRGTFVAKKEPVKFGQSMNEVLRLEDLLKTYSVDGKSELVSIEWLPADMELASILSVEVGEVLCYMKLIGYSNNEPIVIYKSYFPENIGNDLVQIAREMESNSILFSSIDLYHSFHGEKPNKVKYSMEAITSNRETEEVFNLNEAASLMKVSSVFLLPNLQPTEYRQAYYIGEKHIFYITGDLVWE